MDYYLLLVASYTLEFCYHTPLSCVNETKTQCLQTFLIAYVFIGFYLFLFLSSGLNLLFKNMVLEPDSV